MQWIGRRLGEVLSKSECNGLGGKKSKLILSECVRIFCKKGKQKEDRGDQLVLYYYE